MPLDAKRGKDSAIFFNCSNVRLKLWVVQGHGPGRLRNEIWVRPEGGGRRLHRTTSAQEELEAGDAAASTAEAELSNLSTSDLNRRFNNTFLYLVGKLYTNINIDTFAAAADLLQKEFRILLSRSPLPIDSKRLVQIMALNMFVIDDTKYGQEFNLYQVIFTI